MIWDDLKKLKTGIADLRKFGLVVGGVFVGLGLLFLLRGKTYHPWFLAPGIALVALGLLWPKALKPIYIAWMSLAMLLGFVVSHVVLTLLFYCVVTSIGLLARCFGKDFLQLKLDRHASTYWMPRERRPDMRPEEYERQF